MTLQDLLDALEARFARIDAELESAAAGDRERLRQEIVGLFRETEGAIESLSAFKERIRGLVERYKALPPPEAAPRAQPVVADLIGSTTYVERGWSAIAAGDAKRAVKELERALELAPNDPNTETLLGWAQMLREQYDDALMTYYKVLMKDPNNPLARVNLGYICLKKGIFGEAIEHLSKAIRLDNDRKATLYAHFYLGLVYLERDMFEDAQTFFQKSLALGPNLIEAYFELGRAYWYSGQRQEAMQAWRDGFAANKFNPWGKRCAEVLQTVEQGGEP